MLRPAWLCSLGLECTLKSQQFSVFLAGHSWYYKRMIVVIIAGGSGSRLWPLSTPDYPKHLLNLTNDKSLLQNTYSRAKLLGDEIYIISEASHVSHVFTQLPGLDPEHVVIEPGRRGTASCVIAALARIRAQHDNDEPIVFMHADHHIRDTRGFVDTVKRASTMSIEKNKLVLLGLEPTYASTAFGYIERGEHANGGRPVYKVLSFKEKPDRRTAQRYLSSGRYLWNMGYFVAPVSVFEEIIARHAPHLNKNYKKLRRAKTTAEHDKKYLSFKSEPIDTALIERVSDLLVMPGTFDWMDVGSFPDMHSVNEQDEQGNTLQGSVIAESVSNSLIRNDTDVPVIVIGLDNVAVISTPHGMLVTNKTHAQKVGDASKKLLIKPTKKRRQ
jgi:mannose-1-phosphate guanylyltransferase